jgi:hypothetical protein
MKKKFDWSLIAGVAFAIIAAACIIYFIIGANKGFQEENRA